MITGITIENFKGIRERVELQLRPLTLLFGPNSAGKSSILHALHYAHEVFARRNLDADRTVSGGKYVDLGGFRKFVHGGDRSRVVTLGITLGGPMYDDLAVPPTDPWFEVPDELRHHVEVEKELHLVDGIARLHVEASIAWSERRQTPYVQRYSVLANDERVATISCDDVRGTVCLREINYDHPLFPAKFTGDLPSLVDYLEDLEFDDVTGTVGREKQSDEVSEPSHNLSDRDKPMSESAPIGETGPRKRHRWLELASRLNEHYFPDGNVELRWRTDALPCLGELLPIEPVYDDREMFPGLSDTLRQEVVESYNAFVMYISYLLSSTGLMVRDELKSLHYLGPLRETPSREFAPPRYADPSRWSSGLGAWDELMTGPAELVESTSRWLGDEDRLASGYRIERRQFKEVALDDPLIVQLQLGRAFDDVEQGARLALDRLPTRTRLVITPTNGDLELQPHDVGIGISQVVPVIVTSLGSGRRIVAIEQPELHLHPKLQAALGDLFIEATLGETEHKVILETHSEHLILRLLRRIRETSAGESKIGLPPIKPDDVSVAYVARGEQGTTVVVLPIDETGDFTRQWPDGFFEERAAELF